MRRTWSVRGRTPILRHRYHWNRASMAAALGLQSDSYDTDSLIGVLDQLKGFYTGRHVVLLWANAAFLKGGT
jgi:hypothetical protein